MTITISNEQLFNRIKDLENVCNEIFGSGNYALTVQCMIQKYVKNEVTVNIAILNKEETEIVKKVIMNRTNKELEKEKEYAINH